jgi:hypothetical protein
VWKRSVQGRVLTFRLIGINNQNFLMEDLETRSWWQQVSGAAISGPLKGQHLDPVIHDEVTYGLWCREHPAGRVFALNAEDDQIREEWESRTATLPTVVAPTVVPARDTLESRAVIVGVTVEGQAKAYPQTLLRRTHAVMDRVGSTPVAVLMGADDNSTRVFDRRIDDRELELLVRPGSSPAVFLDAETGSEWDISGIARSGPLAGRTLRRLPQLTDYWFDWQLYHPDTRVYREWRPTPAALPDNPAKPAKITEPATR